MPKTWTSSFALRDCLARIVSKRRYNEPMTVDDNDDNFFDHPDDIIGDTTPLTEEEGELFVLFAEALDPGNPKTVEEAKAEWSEVL